MKFSRTLKKNGMISATLLIVPLLAGCETFRETFRGEEREALLAQPVNCETAAQDIAALEAAMPSTGQRAVSVVRTLTPVGALAGVATGTYRDGAAVLTGRTKEELAERIKEIQVTCGIPETGEKASP